MRRGIVVWGVGIAAACSACVQILGDDFEITGTEGAGASTGPSSGGSAGNGGSGGALLENGESCSDAAECASGLCSDEVCCDLACAGACESCALTASLGTCTPHAPATDPEEACAGACDGASNCADGVIQWGVGWGNDTTELNLRGRVAADADGNVAIYGDFYGGQIDFGGESYQITAFGSESDFLTVLDAQGVAQWAAAIGGPTGAPAPNNTFASPQDVTFDVAGSVVTVGLFRTRIQFGSFPSDALIGDNANFDAFVARWSASGTVLWMRGYGAAGQDQATAVATDANGNVIVGGSFVNVVDFDGEALDASTTPDLFLLKLGGGGARVWSVNFDGLGVRSLSTDPAGRIGLVGLIGAGSPSLGGGSLIGTSFVGVMNGDSSHVWSRGFDVTAMYDAVLDADGSLFAVGSFVNTVDLGGETLVSDGDDYFLVKFDPDGNHVFSFVIKASGGAPEGIGVDDFGNVTLSANCSSMEVAQLTATVAVGTGVCALKVANDGTPLWLYTTLSGSPDNQGVAVTPDGRVAIAGRYSTGLDFGLGDIGATFSDLGAFAGMIGP